MLSAGCCRPSCCAPATTDSPSPSGGGPGSRKQTNRPTSKQPSTVCPHPQFPLPICWQWKELPSRKAWVSELYPPWLSSCTLWPPILSSLLSSRKTEGIGRLRHCVGKAGPSLGQPWDTLSKIMALKIAVQMLIVAIHEKYSLMKGDGLAGQQLQEAPASTYSLAWLRARKLVLP